MHDTTIRDDGHQLNKKRSRSAMHRRALRSVVAAACTEDTVVSLATAMDLSLNSLYIPYQYAAMISQLQSRCQRRYRRRPVRSGGER